MVVEMLIEFVVVLAIFLVLTLIGVFVYNKLKNSSNSYLNPREFLPEDEIHVIRQVLYLSMMALCFVNFLYSLMSYEDNFIYFAVFDIVL